MLTSYHRITLERYSVRTYGIQFYARLASIVLVATAAAYLKVWPVAASILWVAAFWGIEITFRGYWLRLQPNLDTSSESALVRSHRIMLLGSTMASWVVAIPCLVTPFAGHSAALMGLFLSCGSIMVIAAQHNLHRFSYLFNTPAPCIALLMNAHALAGTGTPWLFDLFGVFFILNAFSIHLTNFQSFNDIVQLQIDAANASSTKSIFLARMGHEIRTPLNGVLGMADVMSLGDLNPVQRTHLDIIKASGRTLLTLLNDLLDFSKIEAGKLDVEWMEMNLSEVLQASCDSLSVLAEEKGLAMVIDTTEVNATYLGDPTRIRQIVQNLVSNAIKFTYSGTVTVQARATETGVRIRIIDTGVGVSEENSRRLFAEFVQVDAINRTEGGTGLGLAICRELARLMGGDVTLQSELGNGSTFEVKLPLKRIADSAPKAASPQQGEEAALNAADAAPLRVLIAEDNRSNQIVLQSLLSHTSCRCAFVENGQDALDAWVREDWDLILMDIQMPVMDGMAATRAIRAKELESGRKRTPIWALTADVMVHQTADHRAAGLDGHISKPIEVSSLFSLLEDIATLAAAESEAPRQACA
jgi:signal transduction histidine kinase/CheY-like chemotaxis protein